MLKISGFLILFFIFCAFPAVTFAQKNEGVEVIPRLSTDELAKQCRDLEIGKIVFFLKPDYPTRAFSEKLSGTVKVTLNIDENGIFLGISKVEGKSPFLETAIQAAQRVKFTPTVCNGKPISVSGLITYIFTSIEIPQSYFIPNKIEDFKDVNKDSKYYEAIFNLTENYKISFGYPDNKFHEEFDLTRGDFLHFLRLTLDLLFERARFVNKNPLEIGLFRPYNPNKLSSSDEIRDLNINLPSNDSALTLIKKYKVALVNEDLKLNSSLRMTQNEVIEIWVQVFGNEALPIHFKKTKDEEKYMTRGEFALFLQESLRVLTYKVLP